MNERTVLAVDIGAGSGRVIAGTERQGQTKLQEVYRFAHDTFEENGFIRWDYERIEHEVLKGIELGARAFPDAVSIGIDSFCPDYCTLNGDGSLAENVRTYRNFLDGKELAEVTKKTDEEDFVRLTGTRSLSFALLVQLHCQMKDDYLLAAGKRRILPLPNRLNEKLSGRACTDYTQASVSMLMDRKTQTWSIPLCERYSIPLSVLPEIVPYQTVLGVYRLPSGKGLKVIQTGTHDTAVAAYYLSCLDADAISVNIGTWTFAGIRTTELIRPGDFIRSGLWCYGLPDGSDFYCRTMLGTWYLRQLIKGFAQEGKVYSYEELAKIAQQTSITPEMIPDLSKAEYQNERNSLPGAIRRYQRTTEGKNMTDGQIARVVYEYLKNDCMAVIRDIEKFRGRTYENLIVGGGGTKDSFLMKLLRNGTGKKVRYAPVETTAEGNIAIQTAALGREN